MSKIMSVEDMAMIMREKFTVGGVVEFTPKGRSMLPMLRDNKDKVVIAKPHKKLKKYDLPFYQRDDGKYVLHRVIKVCKDNTYIMCGDNQIYKEKGLRDDNIIGIVVEFERKGKRYSCNNKMYLLYCRVWCSLYPIRLFYKIGRGYLGRIKRKITRKLKISRKNER